MSGNAGGLGKLIGGLFGGKKDKKIKAPGYNCGACGYENCAKMTEAVKQGDATWDKCTVLKLQE